MSDLERLEYEKEQKRALKRERGMRSYSGSEESLASEIVEVEEAGAGTERLVTLVEDEPSDDLTGSDKDDQGSKEREAQKSEEKKPNPKQLKPGKSIRLVKTKENMDQVILRQALRNAKTEEAKQFVFENHIKKLEKRLAVQSSAKLTNELTVQGDYRHLYQAKPALVANSEILVKDLKGPSVSAGIFFETRDTVKEGDPIPRPEDEREARFERVDPDYDDPDETEKDLQETFLEVREKLTTKGASVEMVNQWDRLKQSYKKSRLKHCMAEYKEMAAEIEAAFGKFTAKPRIDLWSEKYDRINDILNED